MLLFSSNFDVFHGTETDLRSATYRAGARGARKKRPVSTDTLGTEIKSTPMNTSTIFLLRQVASRGNIIFRFDDVFILCRRDSVRV